MFYFSEPHDGIHGAMKALPKAVKAVIDGLENKRMSLAAALSLIENVKPEGTRVTSSMNESKTEGHIMLKEGDLQNMPCHVWLLIKFSEKPDENSNSK